MKISVRAHELAGLLDQAPPGLTTLSLDCFDTLLWRDGHAPRDVFTGIAVAGGGIEPRMWAEAAARRAALTERRTNEVSIEQIYRRLLPAADKGAVAEAVAHELALEARHCFGFAPIVALMRAARARGLAVVIVSDTYLSEAQLRALIAAAAGEEVLALIDRVFVSSEHDKGKGGGLFEPVLAALGVAPQTVLHVGDNLRADQTAPAALGIATAHFRQFDAVAEQRLRLETAAAAIIDPATRVTMPAFQPHRPQLSLRRADTPEARLGHDVMGPLMHAFAVWVRHELAAMAVRLGRPVKPLFLMRDGHLPMQVFEALFPEAGARAIEISRFVAGCASLTDAAALDRFVTEAIERTPVEVVARQILLFEHEIAKIAKARPSPAAFRRVVLEPAMAAKILARAKGFADRLGAHLAAQGVAPGDAVMLVDLGYNGSVQNLVEPMLRERFGLEVAGRYLLLREEQQTGLDKAGLLDTRHYDYKMLHALCGCVAVLEQLCTAAQGSVTDYTPQGEPVRKTAGIKGAQSTIRDAVQAACIDFARTVDHGVVRPSAADGDEARRRMAAAILARLLFLPIAEEVALFEAFDHDVNLGTKQTVKLLDTQESADGLRRRGLSYLNETGRMYVPGELQGHGLPLNLSLFSASRFALNLRNSDFEVGGVDLSVILADAADQSIFTFPAHPTADGFYRVAVPVGTSLTAAIQLGSLCEHVQLEDAAFHRVTDFDGSKVAQPIPAPFIADGMEQLAPGLYAAGAQGMVIVPPPANAKEAMVLTLIFRPVRWRQADQARKAA